MSAAAQTLRPPSRTLMLLEGRAIQELGAFVGALPLLSLAPRGDGHPVLVLPGLAASDLSTRPLRRFLRDQGWSAHGWERRPNHHPRPAAGHRGTRAGAPRRAVPPRRAQGQRDRLEPRRHLRARAGAPRTGAG